MVLTKDEKALHNQVNILPRRQLVIALATPPFHRLYSSSQLIKMMLYGRLSDVFGRKVVFISAALLLCVSDFLCSFSQNAVMFYVFRALAGIGGGGVLNLNNIIISDIVSLEQRGKIQAIAGATVGLGNIIGPFIAAGIMQRSSW
ncbi:hypothetical protein J7337_012189 [Fusarium musae]|uniref:Major facilitator superfamily (MFS) profile domain-containing protein n=1 Tax=Fusarium musae TaxID=1042133 RepID=A0A9P8IIZ8_9HYPO|nr:hypothetical protein J7337_012189 [Fusarium musae]KAG9495635.1 hypothetical protein J7337_012189 [Fusarium musae]